MIAIMIKFPNSYHSFPPMAATEAGGGLDELWQRAWVFVKLPTRHIGRGRTGNLGSLEPTGTAVSEPLFDDSAFID
jgi:hypothetical protein